MPRTQLLRSLAPLGQRARALLRVLQRTCASTPVTALCARGRDIAGRYETFIRHSSAGQYPDESTTVPARSGSSERVVVSLVGTRFVTMVQAGLLLHFRARSRRIRIFRYTLAPEPLSPHNLEGPLTKRHESSRKRYTVALAGTAGLALRGARRIRRLTDAHY